MTDGITRRQAAGVLAAGVLSVGSLAAQADDAPAGGGPAADESEKPSYRAVEDLETAHRLIEYGRRTRSPEALLAAAVILARTPVEPVSEPADGGDPSAADPADEPKGLLKEAQALRPNDKPLADLIARTADALSESPREVKGGAITWPAKRVAIGKGQSITQKLTFTPGTTKITASHMAILVKEKVNGKDVMTTKPSQYLTLELTDPKGNVVRVRDKKLASLPRHPVPKPGGVYTVRITNEGPHPATVEGYAG